MHKTIRALAALVVVGLIAGVLPALAQDQAPAPAPAPAQAQAAVAQGELVRVDAKTSTLIIKAADGAQMQFRYTEQTKVTGSDEKVAGLATMTGAQLAIRYTQQQQDKVATEIAVQKSK